MMIEQRTLMRRRRAWLRKWISGHTEEGCGGSALATLKLISMAIIYPDSLISAHHKTVHAADLTPTCVLVNTTPVSIFLKSVHSAHFIIFLDPLFVSLSKLLLLTRWTVKNGPAALQGRLLKHNNKSLAETPPCLSLPIPLIITHFLHFFPLSFAFPFALFLMVKLCSWLFWHSECPH